MNKSKIGTTVVNVAIITFLLSLSVGVSSTYADTDQCHATQQAITGSIVEKGVSVFGKTPDITIIRGTSISVLLKLLHAKELEDVDTVSFFTEPQAQVGFVLYSKDQCALAVGTLPTKTINKVIEFINNAQMINAEGR